MKTDMTSKERILATCRGLPTDHVPFHLEVHPGYLDYDPSIANWKDQFERTDFLLSYGVDAMVEVWLTERRSSSRQIFFAPSNPKKE